jgi:hypothetical protein
LEKFVQLSYYESDDQKKYQTYPDLGSDDMGWLYVLANTFRYYARESPDYGVCQSC